MRKLLIIGPLALLVVAVGWALAAPMTTSTSLSAVQSFKCLDMGGTVSSTGTKPSVVCSQDDSGAHLSVTSPATTISTPIPAPASSSVTVNSSHTSTSQTASSGNVSIDENSSSSTNQGNVTNNSYSRTTVTITNH
jgi:hypothetical protein